jgi:hypothetical protein
MKNESGIVSTMIGAVIAFFCLTVFMSVKYVIVPILRFAVRMILKGMQKGGSAIWAKINAPKTKPAVRELPTPDVFKGMPNLAQAKELRLR